jgi:hypothetical protein
MPSLLELQQAFVRGMFGASDDAVAQWVVPAGRSPHARLAVYRNNVFHNLREALRDVYPVIERLVGGDFFAQAANRYIRDHDSESGDLHRFGAEFPRFLASYPPARELPYLADTARLEWLVHLAFHAADRPALPLARLAVLDADDYERLRFRLHPACRLLASAYPVQRIWAVNQPGYAGDDTVDLALGPARLLVRRPQFAIEVDAIGAGEFALLEQFACGGTLAQACLQAVAAEPGFDLGGILRKHVEMATLVEFDVADA